MSKKEKRIWSKFDTLLVVLGIGIIVGILFPSVSYFLEKGHARDALREAKSVRLSAQATAYDYKELEGTYTDSANENGISKDAEQAILSLASANGYIQYLDFDNKKFQVVKMVYLKDEFCVKFELAGEEASWQVYKISEIVNF